MAQTHYFPTDQVHFTWDTGHEPVITIADGDTVVIETRDVSDNQIGPDSDASVIDGLDWDRVYPLAGPIRVEGAAPGDTLAVEILDLRTRGWGWTAILPGLGLLRRRLPRRLPEDLRHLQRPVRVLRGRGRDPAHAVHGHDGRLPGRRLRGGRDAARALRRQHGHAPARARHDALPARRGRGRELLHRRRARLPGRRRGLRHRPRGADVRVAALLRREGPQHPRRRSTARRRARSRRASTAGRSTAPPASGRTSTRARRTRCGR